MKRQSVKSSQWAKAARASRLARPQRQFTPSRVPRGFKQGVERVSGFYGRFNQGQGGGEDKFFDTSLNIPFDLTGEVPATGGQLNLIPQGVTESTRVGRKATIKSIQIRGVAQFVPAGAAAVASDVVYLYVVLDKQANGAAAAVTDVLTSATIPVGMINMANSERFTILKRFVMKLGSNAGATTAFGNDSKSVEWYHKCNIPLEFSSTTGAITEIKSNNVFLLAGSSYSDDVVTLAGTCRIRFSDN